MFIYVYNFRGSNSASFKPSSWGSSPKEKFLSFKYSPLFEKVRKLFPFKGICEWKDFIVQGSILEVTKVVSLSKTIPVHVQDSSPAHHTKTLMYGANATVALVVVAVLLLNVHSKQLWSCWDSQLA